MTYSVPCDPPAAAACDGFNFFRDQKGAIVGRCVWCLVGFSISEENAADVMVTHLNVVHGRGVLSSAGTRATAIFPAATSTTTTRAGRNQSCYVLTPVATKTGCFSRYVVTDETGMQLGEAKSVKEAMAIAQRHADAERGRS